MAGSSSTNPGPAGVSGGVGTSPGIQKPGTQKLRTDGGKARLGPVHRLIAFRRIRQKPFFAAFVALSMALTVIVSYIVAIMVSQNIQELAATAVATPFPYDALVIFPQKGRADQFILQSRTWRRRVYLTKGYVVKGDSQSGPVVLLGSDPDLPLDTASFLGTEEIPQGSFQVYVTKFLPSGTSKADMTYDISSQPRGSTIGSFVKLQWPKTTVDPFCEKVLDASQTNPLAGWVKVNPKTLEKIPGASEVVSVTFDKMYDTEYLKDALYGEIKSTLRRFPEATCVSPRIGQENLKTEAGRAFSLWHMISVLVLLASAASISCVLTVSFLGRKRSLGIMRVLGTTMKDLRHMMIIEASYLGIPGILLGLLGGGLLAKVFLGVRDISSGAIAIGILMGIGTLVTGVWLPLRLVRNASCDQLLNNRPVYVMSNPSCANCGLCGGV